MGKNSRAVDGLTLSQVIEGFLLAQEARRLSPNTIRDYTTTLRKFSAALGDRRFNDLTAADVRAWFASLAGPQPRAGVAPQGAKPLSNKTLLNYHVGLSALWSWATTEGLGGQNIMRSVEAPRPEQPAISPLSEADVKAILDACARTPTFARRGKRASDRARITEHRDRALIFLLLDTGMRASEVCELTFTRLDLRNRRAYVQGKGDKDRVLPFSVDTGRVLWRYISTERAEATMGDTVFVTTTGAPMNRLALLTLLKRLGERAGVPDCHPHRFRHTFAINFLRNGGNAYELQMMLGHSTLEMVRRYLQLADTDIEAAHREASPVARWRLLNGRR